MSPANPSAWTTERDLRDYARVLLKRRWVIVPTFLLAVGAAALVTTRTDQIYEAQATMFVGQRQIAVEQLSEGVALTQLSQQLVRSYAQVVTSRSIARAAVTRFDLRLAPSAIAGSLRVQPIADTQVIALAFRSTDPALAQRVVNAVAETFVDEIGKFDSPQGDTERPAVRVSIIDRAVLPSTPVAPNPTQNLTLAAILGLVGGVGLAFLFDRLDVSVKSREQIEQMGVTVLGVIPALDTHGEDVYLEHDTQGIGGESFRKLRTSIGFAGVEDPIKSVLVTSPVSEEGKTTLSLNLASAYALGGFRTLLLEADLRRPSLHHVFGVYGTRGLTTVIVGAVPLTEAIVNTDARNLSILLAGAIPPNPVELLASEQMIEILGRLRVLFDVVIIDSPPLVPVADASTLARHCDGVVVVTRVGRTDRRRLAESVQVVQRAGGNLLGVVLNFVSEPSPEDYKYSYYGYRAPGVSSAEKTETH